MFIALCAVLAAGVCLAVAFTVRWARRQRLPVAEAYRAKVELHAIRRRFHLAVFEIALRRDAANARRALRAELYKQDKGGRL